MHVTPYTPAELGPIATGTAMLDQLRPCQMSAAGASPVDPDPPTTMHKLADGQSMPLNPAYAVKGGIAWDCHDEPSQCITLRGWPSALTTRQSTGAVHVTSTMNPGWLLGGDTSLHAEPSPRSATFSPVARQCHESKHETAKSP